MKMIRNIVAMGLVGGLLVACASNDSYLDRSPRENAVRGAAVGAGIGAGVGAISSKKHRGRNAAIGAGVGAAAGAITNAR